MNTDKTFREIVNPRQNKIDRLNTSIIKRLEIFQDGLRANLKRTIRYMQDTGIRRNDIVEEYSKCQAHGLLKTRTNNTECKICYDNRYQKEWRMRNMIAKQKSESEIKDNA